MTEQLLLDQADQALCSARKNPGQIILITGGPTCEDIDPVRFITNRSTGKMGIEAANAAIKLGLSPLLILGPTPLREQVTEIPLVKIRSADDMFKVLDHLFPQCDFLIMSAAVADFTPRKISITKLKKADIQNDNQEFTLTLKRTRDILYELNNTPCRKTKHIAGFSLDTTMNINEGLRKLNDKGLDLIVINSTAAFEKDYSTIKIITRDHKEIELTDNSKFNTAIVIIKELLRLKSSTEI